MYCFLTLDSTALIPSKTTFGFFIVREASCRININCGKPPPNFFRNFFKVNQCSETILASAKEDVCLSGFQKPLNITFDNWDFTPYLLSVFWTEFTNISCSIPFNMKDINRLQQRTL